MNTKQIVREILFLRILNEALKKNLGKLHVRIFEAIFGRFSLKNQSIGDFLKESLEKNPKASLKSVLTKSLEDFLKVEDGIKKKLNLSEEIRGRISEQISATTSEGCYGHSINCQSCGIATRSSERIFGRMTNEA